MANKLLKNCRVCDADIEQRRTYFSVYGTCSKVCYDNLKLINKNNRSLKFEEIECPECAVKFTPTVVAQKRCSPECTYKFHLRKLNNNKTLSEFSIFKRDNFKCVYCGKSSIEDGVKLHIDHIQPICLSGLTRIDNLITSCESCNISKSGSELSNEVKERVYILLLKRNKNISIKQYSCIEREVYKMQSEHNRRLSLLKTLPLPEEQIDLNLK